MAVLIYIPTKVYKISCFTTFSPAFVVDFTLKGEATLCLCSTGLLHRNRQVEFFLSSLAMQII
jgi:hypothetical protein